MMPASYAPSYSTPIPGLPAEPPSRSRSRPASPATVRREIALGNYELSRRCAEATEYNNPLEALHTQLAIAAQEKTLHEDEERQQRRARREARKLAKSLRKLKLEQHGSRSGSRSTLGSRKATPYASEISASSSSAESDSQGEPSRQDDSADYKKHNHKREHRTRRKSTPMDTRRHVSGSFAGKPDLQVHVSQNTAAYPAGESSHSHPVPVEIPDIYLTTPSSASRHSSLPSQPVSPPAAIHVLPTTDKHKRSEPLPSALSTGEPQPPVRSSAGHINHAYCNTVKRAASDKEPIVLHLTFVDGREFDLSHKQLLAGGSENSFLKSWTGSSHRLSDGERLTIKMPHDRDSGLFHVIYDFLTGKQVVPLCSQHAIHICGHDIPTAEVYKQLQKEAKLYGIRDLAAQISVYRKHQKPEGPDISEHFRVYDSSSNVALDKDELKQMARDFRSGSVRPSRPLRAVAIGAAINFMTRRLNAREIVLEYSLVAPLTSISHALGRIVDCSIDKSGGQVVLEGYLTREECRSVVLDIMFNDLASRHEDDAPVIKRHPYTLETVLSVLESPHIPDDSSEHFFDAFNVQYFASQGNGEVRDPLQPKSSAKLADDSASPFFLNLPYATVCLRFSMSNMDVGRSQAVFEQIHTASREILQTQTHAS